MNKLKILLTLLTIAIAVVPIASVVYIYRGNLLGLVVPPQVMNLAKSGGSGVIGSGFEPPQSVGDPQYNPDTRTATFTFNFTNPLKTPITIDLLDAGVKCHSDSFHLGDVSLDKPITFAPGQTQLITAYSILSSDAINHFRNQHAGETYVNVDFTNLNVEVGGVKIQVDQQNVGNIDIPPQLLG
jgi:hypothetical protein